jgi:hypothetical protein
LYRVCIGIQRRFSFWPCSNRHGYCGCEQSRPRNPRWRSSLRLQSWHTPCSPLAAQRSYRIHQLHDALQRSIGTFVRARSLYSGSERQRSMLPFMRHHRHGWCRHCRRNCSCSLSRFPPH